MVRKAKKQGVRRHFSADIIIRHPIASIIIAIVFFGVSALVCFAIAENNGEEPWNIILQVVPVAGFGIIIAALQINQNKTIANRQEQQAKSIADRHSYTTAIEHLSSNSPAVRLKGIRDLCKYNATDEQAAEIQSLFNDQVSFFTRTKDYQESNPTAPPKDIQTLLDILSGRIKEDEKDFKYALVPDQKIDWSGSFLKGADLLNANLQDVNLLNANLQGAHLWDANLQGALLFNAFLKGADLRNANLQDVNLWNANLQDANLRNANLQDANLLNANLQGAFLHYANLQGANLQDANLQGAFLHYANLQGANLHYANLQGAFLKDVNLQGANLNYANLYEVALIGVDLRGVTSDIDSFFGVPFEDQIKHRIETPTDVTSINLGDTITSNEAKEQYLKAHGAVLGTYTKEEAEQWIAAYNAARQKHDPQQ